MFFRYSFIETRWFVVWVVCVLIVLFEMLCLGLLPPERKSYFMEYLTPAEYVSPEENGPIRIEMRPNLMEIINPSDPKYPLKMDDPYRLENKTLCSSVENITVLVIILSSTKNVLNRQALRRTWANGSLYSSHGTVRTLFLLGLTTDPNVQTKIEEEFQLFGDIVQGSFMDTYHNLTLKSIMGYKWVTERCRNAQYVIKTDDDIVVNIFGLVQNHVLEKALERHHVFCVRVYNSQVVRNKKAKSYVEPHQLKGIKVYHPYCNGQFVAMLNEVVSYLYTAAIQTPFFQIDDVHMYGMVMQNIHALKYNTIQNSEIGKYRDRKSLECLKERKAECPILYFVTTNINQVADIWSSVEMVYR